MAQVGRLMAEIRLGLALPSNAACRYHLRTTRTKRKCRSCIASPLERFGAIYWNVRDCAGSRKAASCCHRRLAARLLVACQPNQEALSCLSHEFARLQSRWTLLMRAPHQRATMSIRSEGLVRLARTSWKAISSVSPSRYCITRRPYRRFHRRRTARRSRIGADEWRRLALEAARGTGDRRRLIGRSYRAVAPNDTRAR